VLKALNVPGDPIVSVSFSPDSSHEEDNVVSQLAVSGDYALTGSTDHALHWWSLPSLKNPITAESTYGLGGLSLSAEGKVAGWTSTSSRYLDSEMSLLRWTDEGARSGSFSDLPPPDSNSSYGVPQFSPDGRWAMARTGSDVQLWNLAEADTPSQIVANVDFSGLALGNSHFFTPIQGGLSMRAYAKPNEEVRRFLCPNAYAWVDAQETRLLGYTSEAIWSWEVSAPDKPRKFIKASQGASFSPDLRRAALWQKSRLEVWDMQSFRMLYKLSLKGKLAEARP